MEKLSKELRQAEIKRLQAISDISAVEAAELSIHRTDEAMELLSQSPGMEATIALLVKQREQQENDLAAAVDGIDVAKVKTWLLPKLVLKKNKDGAVIENLPAGLYMIPLQIRVENGESHIVQDALQVKKTHGNLRVNGGATPHGRAVATTVTVPGGQPREFSSIEGAFRALFPGKYPLGDSVNYRQPLIRECTAAGYELQFAS